MAEGYFQHAEHYFRILNAMNQAAQQGQAQNGQQQPPRRNYVNGEDVQPELGGEGLQDEDRVPGTGEQPEARDIPIAAAPPSED